MNKNQDQANSCPATTVSPSRPRLLGERAARHELGGIGHTLFWQLIKKGEIEVVHLGARTLVVSESIDRLIESTRAANRENTESRNDAVGPNE
jgi:hypothetical protein